MYQRRTPFNNAGDIKWTNYNMDRDIYRDMMINLVLPDIKKKMPLNNNIIIQQDGAKAHILDNDEAFYDKVEELYNDRDAVKLYTQPANSPDLNVNDLGFFASLQSIYYRTSPKNSIELIEMVEEAFNKYPSNKLNRIWLTLQSCMNMIIESNGDNQYKIPHMNKDRLERTNTLPVSIEVTNAAKSPDYDLQTLVDP